MTTTNEPADSVEMATGEPATHKAAPHDSAPRGDMGSGLPDKASASPTAGSTAQEAAGNATTNENTTVALDMADLAAAVDNQVTNNGDTQPIPILATRLQPPDSAPSHVASATVKPGNVSRSPNDSGAGAPVAAEMDTDPPLDATPKAMRRPTPAIPDADPNATNQLPQSGGLTGLDVLGTLDSSSGSRAFASAVDGPLPGGIVDEVDPEWALADQPTLQITPLTRRPARPAFLETGEQEVWPPRPTPAPAVTRDGRTEPGDQESPSPYEPGANPRPIPRPATRPVLPQERLASPTGRRPLGNTDAAYSDPRRRRYVELQMQRGAHDHGQPGPADIPPIAQMVRQWWKDLMPGLQTALDHQHEARASGVYPLPAHEVEPAMGTRLGDAFGRLAAAVRDLGERAQSAAMPALTRMHERAEQAAQAIVGRLEGPQARQQAPFLGPGRLAVFFRQGVTVGQAQRLLLIHRAQPMRLIPRKHGFLARVMPGREAEVGAELRQHPYVRDVVYLEYNGAAGEPAAAAH